MSQKNKEKVEATEKLHFGVVIEKPQALGKGNKNTDYIKALTEAVEALTRANEDQVYAIKIKSKDGTLKTYRQLWNAMHKRIQRFNAEQFHQLKP